MLIGAFFGVVGSYYFKSAFIGVLFAIGAAVVASLDGLRISRTY